MNRNHSISLLCSIVLCATGSVVASQAAKTSGQAAEKLATHETMQPNMSIVHARVLYVDATKVLESSVQGQQTRVDIQNEYKKSMTLLEQQTQNYQQALRDFEQKSAVLSSSARDEEVKKLTKMEKALKDSKEEAEEELRTGIARKNELLTKNLLAAAEQLGNQYAVDSVVDIKSGTVLWVRETYNYTTQLVQVMDKQYQALQPNLMVKSDQKITSAPSKAVS